MTTAIVSTFLPYTTEAAMDDLSTVFDNVTINTTAPSIKGPQPKDYLEYWAALFINKYYLYVIVGLGLPGNIAALVTLTVMKPMTSSSLYMTILCVVDSGNLIIKILYLELTYYDIQLGDRGCSFIFFIGTFGMHYSNWILVAMTVERFIAIWFPLKVVDLCTRKRAAIVTVIIGTILLFVNLHFCFSIIEGWNDTVKWTCDYSADFVEFMNTVWYWIDGALYSMIPFAILMIFNTLIIIGMRRHQRAMSSKIDKTKLTDKMKQQQQITFMLISVSVVFVILTLPNCLFFIGKNYWNYQSSAYQTALYFLLFQVVFVLSDLNHAINFYLYFLSGRKFRQRFVSMICCRKKPIRRPTSTMYSNMESTRFSNSHRPASTDLSVITNGHSHAQNGQSYDNNAYDSRL